MLDPNFLITVDVEDWFQVENFKNHIPFSSWSSCELRVERNVHRLLDLFDSVKLDSHSRPRKSSAVNPSHPGGAPSPKATFFVLGWIAGRIPHLVREIDARGHEIASHGYKHELCNDQSPGNLTTDLVESKKLLEDVIGRQVYGYRAPSFSINDQTLKIIEQSGYRYDSSYNSFAMHERYGRVDMTRYEKKGISIKISNAFHELPISNLKFGVGSLPWGGGGYFRLMPFWLFRRGVQTILNKAKAYLFYVHPWEIDPGQPRLDEAARVYRFRHYVNLKGTYSKLSKFFLYFDRCRFITCHQYLNQVRDF
ncbi:MAG: DUF3473 domain-containing protein [Desulfobacterales bacterium]|nr:DUF3473 domain-containing protein [Desulfobacterales bacterium]